MSWDLQGRQTDYHVNRYEAVSAASKEKRDCIQASQLGSKKLSSETSLALQTAMYDKR